MSVTGTPSVDTLRIHHWNHEFCHTKSLNSLRPEAQFPSREAALAYFYKVEEGTDYKIALQKSKNAFICAINRLKRMLFHPNPHTLPSDNSEKMARKLEAVRERNNHLTPLKQVYNYGRFALNSVLFSGKNKHYITEETTIKLLSYYEKLFHDIISESLDGKDGVAGSSSATNLKDITFEYEVESLNLMITDEPVDFKIQLQSFIRKISQIALKNDTEIQKEIQANGVLFRLIYAAAHASAAAAPDSNNNWKNLVSTITPYDTKGWAEIENIEKIIEIISILEKQYGTSHPEWFGEDLRLLPTEINDAKAMMRVAKKKLLHYKYNILLKSIIEYEGNNAAVVATAPASAAAAPASAATAPASAAAAPASAAAASASMFIRKPAAATAPASAASAAAAASPASNSARSTPGSIRSLMAQTKRNKRSLTKDMEKAGERIDVLAPGKRSKTNPSTKALGGAGGPSKKNKRSIGGFRNTRRRKN
jgi:hypothetical protein